MEDATITKKQEPVWQHGTEKNGKRKPPASYHFTTVEVAWALGEKVAGVLVALRHWEKCLKQVFLTMADAMQAARGKKPEVVLP